MSPVWFVALIFAGLLTPALRCLPQSFKPDDLNQELSFRVPDGRIECTFVQCLGETARAFNIPMGISWVNAPSGQQKRAVEYNDATVLEVIQDIAKTEPDYEVRIANKVVHIETKAVPGNQNFLYLTIPQFSTNGNVAAVVTTGLRMLLNQQIAPNPQKGYGASIVHNASDPKLNLQFTNASVEEILDAIAVASTQKVWVVTFEEKPDHRIPSGFRRTQSLDSTTFVPDEAQPVWNIFRWDYWPVTVNPVPDKN